MPHIYFYLQLHGYLVMLCITPDYSGVVPSRGWGTQTRNRYSTNRKYTTHTKATNYTNNFILLTHASPVFSVRKLTSMCVCVCAFISRLADLSLNLVLMKKIGIDLLS